MLNLAEQTWGRYNGGQNAPIGTYINLRTMAHYQQTSDGVLPLAGTFCPISTSATLTAAQIATGVNNVLGTTYSASNFHVHTSADLISNPGQACNDA